MRYLGFLRIGLSLCALASATLNADFTQQPDETVPGFKSQQVYDVNGADSVNLFSGDVHVTVPLGPEYPLSSGLAWRLAAHYSSKFWHMFQYANGLDGGIDCPGVPGYEKRAHVGGYSTLGVGWTLELGFVRPGAGLGDQSTLIYKSPDGAHHTFTNVDADSNLRLDRQADGTYFVRKSDGTILKFTHLYEIPAPVNGFDFSDEDRYVTQFIPRQMLRYGLGSIVDRFGNTVLQVTYLANCVSAPCSANAWKVASVQLANPTRTITFNWGLYNSSSGSFDVVNSINFPIVGAGTLTAGFTFKPDGTVSRSTFDSDYYHGQSPYVQPGPATTNLPFLASITQSSQTYSFDYDTSTYSGVLQTLTLPTGGKIVYGYSSYTAFFPQRCGTGGTCVPERDAGVLCTLGPAPGDPAIPATIDRCTDLAFKQRFVDGSPAVVSRTEQDLSGGAADSTTTYERHQFGSAEGFGEPLSEDRIVRRVIVKRPDGNGNMIATKHLFAAALDGKGGFELSRRYYANCDTGGTPVRSFVQCFPGVAHCGVMETSTQISSFLDVSSLRPNQQVTWYGENPLVSTKDTCMNSGSPSCWQDAFTDFNPNASEYSTVTRSSNSGILTYPQNATRTTTTNWTPVSIPGGTWLPKLYSSKTVTDAPCTSAPCTVTTNYSFDTSNGFLNWSSVTDGTYGTLTRSLTRDSSTGDPLTESLAASFDSTTFTNTRAFQSGLAKSVRRTAPAGIGWNSFDTNRDASTGFITTSRDPNGLSTTYQYDALSRLTAINPPGGELATTYCYNAWISSSPSDRAYVLVKKGGGVCSLDDGAPGIGSGGVEAYQYDGRGRLVRQARRLPSALPATGSIFSFKEIRYNEAGLKSFESEWVPCGVTFGSNNVKSCFSSAAGASYATSYSNFDFLGRAKTVLAPDGFVTTRSFDDGSAVPNSDFFEKDTFNVGGQSVTGASRKDIYGRTLIVAEPNPGGIGPYSGYSYNVLDKLVSVNVNQSGGGGQTRTFTYDALGLLRSQIHPEKGTTTYTDPAAYDALGNLKKMTEGGHTYTYTYDAASRLNAVVADGSTYTSNLYDGQGFAGGTYPLGRLTQQKGYHPLSSANVQAQQNYAYSDPTGRLSSKSLNAINGSTFFNASESFAYNALGLLDTHNHARTSGSWSVTTGYKSGLPTQIASNNLTLVSSATYNPAGGLQSYVTGNGVTTTINQDSHLLPRPLSISTSGADQNFSSGVYSYDGAGNIMSIGSDTFQYDARSRLTKATYRSFGGQFDTLGYDTFGNLNSRTSELGGQSGLEVNTATNRLLGPSYDALGNMTLNGPDHHSYDALSRQTLYTGINANERYFYDGAGERLARVVYASSLPQQSTQESFYNLTPCRILDTRNPAGTYGAPSIPGQGSRSFPVAGVCGIPATAKSLALNVTTINGGTTGNVRLYPTGLSYQPLGTANAFKAGYPRANQTFGSIDGPTAGSFTLFNDAPAGYPVDVIVDVQGYFAPGPNTPPQTGDSWFFTLRDPQNRPSTEYRWDAATPTTTLLKDHVYLGNLLVADYTWFGQPNGLVFYTNDHLGTPRFMTKGTVPKWMATFKYRAFGLALTSQIPGQGIEFASMERDLASSDLYDHARYMGGKLPRFNSPDQLGGHVEDPQSWNRYSYARNNPLKYVDKDGLQAAPPSPGGFVDQAVKLYNQLMRSLGMGNLVPVTWTNGRFAAANPSPGETLQKAALAAAAVGAAADATGSPDKEIVVAKDRWGPAVQHIDDAQKAGQPDVITIDRGGREDRRTESLRGIPTVPGKDRDEYPPAMFKEGGKGASVRPIEPAANRGCGAYIGNECRDLPDGSTVRIVPK